MDDVLVDTSVWIEFFRKKEPYFRKVSKMIDNDSIWCSGLILAELLQGAKGIKEYNTIKEFLHIFNFIDESPFLWEKAGKLSFELRNRGKAVGLADCYIAVSALENGLSLFSTDKHFSVIQKTASLKLI